MYKYVVLTIIGILLPSFAFSQYYLPYSVDGLGGCGALRDSVGNVLTQDQLSNLHDYYGFDVESYGRYKKNMRIGGVAIATGFMFSAVGIILDSGTEVDAVFLNTFPYTKAAQAFLIPGLFLLISGNIVYFNNQRNIYKLLDKPYYSISFKSSLSQMSLVVEL